MNDSDTPETDGTAVWIEPHDDSAGLTLRRIRDNRDCAWDDDYAGSVVPSEFARRLERERDEARRLAERYRYHDDDGAPFPWPDPEATKSQ